MMGEMDSHDALVLVGDFLRRYYASEPHDHVATTNALTSLLHAGDERWTLKIAFEHVLAADYPAQALRDLVKDHASRPVEDDREARGFLWKVYNLNVFDCAVPPSDEAKHE